MSNPRVSFVIPCYKLAHLLPECVNSILSQTYGDLEVLVMDDCSPDDTSEVARSFRDQRVKHVRNAPNLGHLANYNKGIGLARGKYVWLISADDYLRRPYILERYVGLLDRHPRIGYVFCPGYGVRDGQETRVLGRYAQHGDKDRILAGHAVLGRLIRSNFVMTPSSLVRRECYEKLGRFPLNMPWCGDWYLWCLFATYYDVGYFAEPMVCYREHHPLSMTSKLTRERLDTCAEEEIAIPWLIRTKAKEEGYSRLEKKCLLGVAQTYARVMASERYQGSTYFMNFELLEDSLRKYSEDEAERKWNRVRTYERIGNERYWQGDVVSARQFYDMAIANDYSLVSAHLKRLLLVFGKQGDEIRRMIVSLR